MWGLRWKAFSYLYSSCLHGVGHTNSCRQGHNMSVLQVCLLLVLEACCEP